MMEVSQFGQPNGAIGRVKGWAASIDSEDLHFVGLVKGFKLCLISYES
jgi:hypothetical protein